MNHRKLFFYKLTFFIFRIRYGNKKTGHYPVFLFCDVKADEGFLLVTRCTCCAITRFRAHLLCRESSPFFYSVGASIQNRKQPNADKTDGHGE